MPTVEPAENSRLTAGSGEDRYNHGPRQSRAERGTGLKEFRWTKGVSGNPSGRSKAAADRAAERVPADDLPT